MFGTEAYEQLLATGTSLNRETVLTHARTLTAGNMVVWVILMLVGYLIAYFATR